MTGSPDDQRQRAAAVLARLADRLDDPERVVALASGPDNVDRAPDTEPWPVWPAGHPGGAGLALLYSELGRPETAHAHLMSAAGVEHAGLFGGMAGLAFAARTNARNPQDYASAVRALDQHLAEARSALLADLKVRPLDRFSTYDLVVGLTGLGAYHLVFDDLAATGAILDGLATLIEPTTVDGQPVPGWWALQQPGVRQHDRFASGHLNLGLAHGIAGPLALLSMAAAQTGTPGAPAIDAMVGALLARAVPVGDSYRWPNETTLDVERGAVPAHGDRSAWCYGTPGVARAVQLAARARGRPDWADVAVRSLRSVFDRPDLAAIVGDDASICHGWAGLLAIALAAAADSGDERLSAATHRLAGEVLRRYEPAAPFGFRHPPEAGNGYALGPDRPGVLDGAAGIALALSAYAHGWPPRTRWATTFLIG